MPDLSLMIIGSGTLVPDVTRSCSANLLLCKGEQLLIDVGFGTLAALNKLEIDPLTIPTVLITHFHPDHVADLIPLIFTRIYAGSSNSEPLKIVGPVGIADFLNVSASAYGEELAKSFGEVTHIQELSVGLHTLPIGLCEAFPMKHAPESLGYRLQVGDRIVAITGDTGYCDAAIDVCRDADIALIECGAIEDGGNHLSPREVGIIADKAQPKKLLINHCYPNVLAGNPVQQILSIYSGQVEHAYDGMQLTLTMNQND